MSGPAGRAAMLAAAVALAALLAVGCASTPNPPPAAARPPAPPPAESPAAAPAGSAPAEEGETRPPTLVVIDPGGQAPQTLVEAANAERERRRQSTKKPVAVITDKNLAEYAEKGEVTMAHPAEPAPPAADGGAAGAAAPPATPAPPGSAPAESAGAGGGGGSTAGEGAAGPAGPGVADADGPHDEAYWRGRARGARMRWRQATDEVASLEKKAADFRWRFYAADDPVVRDQQIKPEWDRVLDDLRRARQDVRAFQGELAELMEAGRRAGALPGWLREGIELEPEPTIQPNPRQPEEPTDSIEPPVIEDTP